MLARQTAAYHVPPWQGVLTLQQGAAVEQLAPAAAQVALHSGSHSQSRFNQKAMPAA